MRSHNLGQAIAGTVLLSGIAIWQGWTYLPTSHGNGAENAKRPLDRIHAVTTTGAVESTSTLKTSATPAVSGTAVADQALHISHGQGELGDEQSTLGYAEPVVNVTDRLRTEHDRALERQADYVDTLEVTHASEPYDANWAPGFESDLAVAFENSDLVEGVALAQLSCRSDSCVIELSSQRPLESGLAAFQTETFQWLTSAVTECQSFTVRQAPSDEQTNEGSSQRVFLQDCR